MPPTLSHVANHHIPFRTVFLPGENGSLISMSKQEALSMAQEQGLDLVLMSAERDAKGDVQPIVKIMDLGRYKYDKKKRERESRERQVQIDNHEIRVTPTIAENDLRTKAKKAREFLSRGDRVRISLRFRGREITKKEVGMKVLDLFYAEVEDIARVTTPPAFATPKIVNMLLERDKKKWEAYTRSIADKETKN